MESECPGVETSRAAMVLTDAVRSGIQGCGDRLAVQQR